VNSEFYIKVLERLLLLIGEKAVGSFCMKMTLFLPWELSAS